MCLSGDKSPADEYGNRPIVIAVPTHGWLDVDFVANMQIMAVPIHTNSVWEYTKGEEVGEARNHLVRMALDSNAEYIFFRDHDVLAPPDCLTVLRARIEGSDAQVVGGLYYSKQKPPWPLVIRDGRTVTDWEQGDVVKCDAIGMGCTLIKMDVFREMEPPWFVTQAVGACDKPSWMTESEDVHFCKRLIDELGEHPYIDTNVSCLHYNIGDRTQFFYDPASKMAVWQNPGEVAPKGIAPIGHELLDVVDLTKKESEVPHEEDNGVAAGSGDAGAPADCGCGPERNET